MKIHIIAAALPPRLDGIGDYTALLAAELAHSATVTVLTAQTDPDPIPGVKVETVFAADKPRSVWNIARAVAADPPDWVLLQYNPFSYGKWGCNLHLPLMLALLKKRLPGVRIAVMAHETFVPLGVSRQFMVMTLWQRPQFAVLSRTADALFFSIEAWAKPYAAKFPGKPVVHLPVGSNIPRVPITRAEARARLGIPDTTLVLGVFGAMHVSRLMDWVRDAAEAVCATGQEMVVLYIGPDGEAVRSLLGTLPLIVSDGPLPAEEVSRRFAAMDIHLTPFIDGISTRRGSLMTGLQHGVATVGTLGINTDTILRMASGKSFLASEVEAPEQFIANTLALATNAALREKIGQDGMRLYEEEFGWESMAKNLLSVLRKSDDSTIHLRKL